jgi:hypothetical protein
MTENGKTCDKCRERSKKARNEFRENVIMCKKDGCKFKRADEKGYCQKHQICILVEEVVSRNKRLCVNYIRGCREELDLEHKKNRCETCLEKDRVKDKQRRKDAHEHINIENTTIVEKPCTVCCKILPIKMFEGMKGITKTCCSCRDGNKNQDSKRDKTNRNKLARERVYYNYQKWAKKRNIHFNIDKETFENIIKLPCEYCGILQDKGYNGIDRKESAGIYEISNCVSCCEMCNYLKRIDNIEMFTKRIEHILTYLCVIQGSLYPELFTDHTQVSYSIYKKASNQRSIEFQLKEEQFDDIIKNDCYICGKPPTNTHKNGIDRYDSNIGYIAENCRSCCHSCNFLKNNYTYNTMMSKLKQIYDHKLL